MSLGELCIAKPRCGILNFVFYGFLFGDSRNKEKLIINKLSSNFTKIENLGMNGAVSTKVKKTNIWNQNSSAVWNFKNEQTLTIANEKIIEKNKQVR